MPTAPLNLGRKGKAFILAAVIAFSVIAGVSIDYLFQTNPRCDVSGAGGCANVALAAEMTITIKHADSQLHTNLLLEGFTATGCGQTIDPMSSWNVFARLGLDIKHPTCALGWTYTEDPSVTITNEGHCFIQGKVYGVTATGVCAITIVTGDYAVILGASANAGGVAVTDNYGAAGPCDSANILDANGFVPAAATTQTGGVAAAGSVVTAFSITFTAATNPTNSVQVACILTETVGSTHPYIFGEVAFGPDSFAVGDQLVESFSMTSA